MTKDTLIGLVDVPLISNLWLAHKRTNERMRSHELGEGTAAVLDVDADDRPGCAVHLALRASRVPCGPDESTTHLADRSRLAKTRRSRRIQGC